MRRGSWLDQLVRQFQEHWETNPQFRAVVSGGVGLVLVVAMCVFGIIGTTIANSALAGAGLGASNNRANSLNTGTNGLQAPKSFPTPTLAPANSNPIQSSSIPSSQTPPPGNTPTVAAATPATRATPTATPAGTGGSNENVTASVVPAPPLPWMQGTNATITVQTTVPNTNVSITVTFPDNSTKSTTGTTDGSGNYSWQVYVPQGCSGSVQITVQATFSDGTNKTFNVSPKPQCK